MKAGKAVTPPAVSDPASSAFTDQIKRQIKNLQDNLLEYEVTIQALANIGTQAAPIFVLKQSSQLVGAVAVPDGSSAAITLNLVISSAAGVGVSTIGTASVAASTSGPTSFTIPSAVPTLKSGQIVALSSNLPAGSWRGLIQLSLKRVL